MKKLVQIISLIPSLAAMLALACVSADPAFGQEPTREPISRRPMGREPQPQPPQGQPEDKTVSIFNLKYSDAETMARILAQIIPGLNVAIDQRNNAIVVAGTKENAQTADAILRQLDSSSTHEKERSSPVSIRLVWLVEGDEGADPPAEYLKGVVDELRRQGLKNLGQVAQTVVRSKYGNNFHISCSPLLENKPTELSADGVILVGGELEIHIVANRAGGPEPGAASPPEGPGPNSPGAGRQPDPYYGRPPRQSSVAVAEKLTDLNVHTAFKTNEYIVLAMAPIKKITSVFVIQITENNP